MAWPSTDPEQVEIGLYPGATIADVQAREGQISASLGYSVAGFPGWSFIYMGSTMPSGYDGRRYHIVNIQSRDGTLGGAPDVAWSAVTAGTYDAKLITVLSSINARMPNTDPIYLSWHQEQDGAGGQGTAAEYRSSFIHVKALAATYCPRALLGQITASESRFVAWCVPEAEWYGLDPHAYTWNGTSGAATAGTFASRMSAILSALSAAGQAGAPYSVHTGASLPMTTAEAIAAGYPAGNVTAGNTAVSETSWEVNWITDMVNGLAQGRALWGDNLLFATWWDRDGTINNRAADERINSDPTVYTAFIQAFVPTVVVPPDPTPTFVPGVIPIVRRFFSMAG